MISFFNRQNKIQTDVSDLEVFLDNALGPDTSMRGPRFRKTAMKTFTPHVWNTLILRIGTNDANASESLQDIIEGAIYVRFSSLRCVRNQNGGRTQMITATPRGNTTFGFLRGLQRNKEITIQIPNIVLASAHEPEIDVHDWHLRAIFTIDILNDESAVATFVPNVWERCSLVWSSTSRTALYGAIITPDTFRVWKFNRRWQTLALSIPVPLLYDDFDNELNGEGEENVDPEAMESEYHRRVYLALLRIIPQERWMVQEDEPQPASVVREGIGFWSQCLQGVMRIGSCLLGCSSA